MNRRARRYLKKYSKNKQIKEALKINHDIIIKDGEKVNILIDRFDLDNGDYEESFIKFIKENYYKELTVKNLDFVKSNINVTFEENDRWLWNVKNLKVIDNE